MGNVFWDLVKKVKEANRAKHGRVTSAHQGLGLIMEEVNELRKEVEKRKRRRDPFRFLNELVEIAAFCEIMAEDIVASGGKEDGGHTGVVLEEAPGEAPAAEPIAEPTPDGGSFGEPNPGIVEESDLGDFNLSDEEVEQIAKESVENHRQRAKLAEEARNRGPLLNSGLGDRIIDKLPDNYGKVPSDTHL